MDLLASLRENALIIALFSILGSIVLSVVGNLLTIPVQKWLASTSVRRSRKRAEQLEAELAEVQRYLNDPQDLYLLLFFDLFVVIVLQVIATSFIVLAFVFVPVVLVGTFGLGQAASSAFFVITIILCLPLYMVAMHYGTNAVTLIKRVRNFQKYKAQVEEEIARLRGTTQTAVSK